MKLSEAIEQMIVTRKYCLYDHEYMCNSLSHNDLGGFVDAVHDMVCTIKPGIGRGTPLICALHAAGIINVNNMTDPEMFSYTLQVYCWWVFDLKRKGL